MFLTVSNIKSSSVEELSVNCATKQAVVRYHGSERPYLYTGVDFNALYNIVFNQVDSIGKWVNDNLKSVATVECYSVWFVRGAIMLDSAPSFLSFILPYHHV